jgi:hypothetical protein
MHVAFTGQATLVFTTNRLAITGLPGPMWVFSVAGKDTEPASVSGGMATIAAVGLSHYWGQSVEVTHEALAAKVLTGYCKTGALAAAGGGCGGCESGGNGEPECEISCSGGTCSASCGDSYNSCCSCAEGCRCCKTIDEQRPAESTAPAGRH